MLDIVEYESHPSCFNKMIARREAITHGPSVAIGSGVDLPAVLWGLELLSPSVDYIAGARAVTTTLTAVKACTLPSTAPTLWVSHDRAGADEAAAIYLYNLRWQHEQGGVNDAMPDIEDDPRKNVGWDRRMRALDEAIQGAWVAKQKYGYIVRPHRKLSRLEQRADEIIAKCEAKGISLEDRIGLITLYAEGYAIVGSRLVQRGQA